MYPYWKRDILFLAAVSVVICFIAALMMFAD